MSVLLNQPPKLCLRKPTLVRSSPLLPTGFSKTLLQTPPCFLIRNPCGNLRYAYYNQRETYFEKKLPMNVIINDAMVMIGSSHGWVATLKKDDGTLRLQDDLNPVASDTDPKRISLPPLVTLPDCQTQIVTNVAMSSSVPEDEDCVLAVKFLGPQLSFCRPAQSNSKWINIRIANPCFFSSHVMFSEKHNMFRIPGSGGHLIGSWDLHKHTYNPKFENLQFKNLPKLKKTKRELLNSCCTSEHLVESRSTGETFMVKWYKKTAKIVEGIAKMKTEGLMVFKLDDDGNAVYTQDIGDLSLYLSKSEPFCVSPSSFPNERPHVVRILDDYEFAFVNLHDSSIENVASLKERIALQMPFPASKRKLSGKTGVLKDDMSLAYYNVGPRDFLTMSKII